MTRRALVCTFALTLASVTPLAGAQDVSQRIRQIRMQRDIDAEVAAQRSGVSARTALRVNVELALQNIPLRQAVEFLQNISGLNIVINWRAMEEAGISPHQPVSIAGASITAENALNQIIRQMSSDQQIIWEVTPWYVELMTKPQANTRPVTLVYPIGDLLQPIPNFTDAPAFDLNTITQGGQGGGSSGSLFGESATSQAPAVSREEHAEKIAQLIRETIEPEIWREAGGSVGSIRFYRDSLIIRAPMYVHRQIGGYTGAGFGRPIGGAGAVSTGAGIGFDPTIGVVQGGNILDVQAGTADGRYVTISGGISSASVTAIHSVPVQGVVGGGSGGASTFSPAPSGLKYSRNFRDAGIGR